METEMNTLLNSCETYNFNNCLCTTVMSGKCKNKQNDIGYTATERLTVFEIKIIITLGDRNYRAFRA